ncbi:MAG: peptide chain release factor N(5)-glutamine methyltransferase [Actinomycetales bacterium]|nr:peptide chain release factor N(5)-glutamine methyltransferase [Actinomycetales bacterium]
MTTAGRRIREVLVDAERRLRTAGVPSPRADAELLLAHVLQVPRTRLLLLPECDRAAERRLEALLIRRLSREPLQHIVGWAGFRDCVLAVGPGVFVPRPETEILVDVTRYRLTGDGITAPLIVDAGTGSGAIALALALEIPGAQVMAVDVSQPALTWAQRNVDAAAERLAAVGSTVEVGQVDVLALGQWAAGPGPGEAAGPADGPGPGEAAGLLSHLAGRVDALVANPPYIPDDAVPRDPEVALHDPPLALYGGPDGLVIVRALISCAGWLLRPGGWVVVEHSEQQGIAGEPGVPGLLTADGRFTDVLDTEDLTGRPRVTSARWTGPRPPGARVTGSLARPT